MAVLEQFRLDLCNTGLALRDVLQMKGPLLLNGDPVKRGCRRSRIVNRLKLVLPVLDALRSLSGEIRALRAREVGEELRL